jgi:hypothetical protein
MVRIAVIHYQTGSYPTNVCPSTIIVDVTVHTFNSLSECVQVFFIFNLQTFPNLLVRYPQSRCLERAKTLYYVKP